ncbi:MAG: hypothetical protein OEU26_37050, partial [Candidatus Tectomicrobia bacterium]|nr:hypothetical protein [Candidatus Tectomicrobia bacterium]
CALFPDIPPIGFYNSVDLSCLNPQTAWLADIKPDFIGRYESLMPDFTQLCMNLNVNPRIPSRVPNRSEHDHYTTYFTDLARAQAEEFYAADCEQFGYEF